MGKSNNLLYDSNVVLDVMHILWCALDVIEEADATESYLDLLMVMEGYSAYGFVTATGTKIIILFPISDSVDSSYVKELFRKIYRIYVDAISNPFVPIGASPSVIASPSDPAANVPGKKCAFEKKIELALQMN